MMESLLARIAILATYAYMKHIVGTANHAEDVT